MQKQGVYQDLRVGLLFTSCHVTSPILVGRLTPPYHILPILHVPYGLNVLYTAYNIQRRKATNFDHNRQRRTYKIIIGTFDNIILKFQTTQFQDQ